MPTRSDHSIQVNVRASTHGSSEDFVKSLESTPGVTSAEPLFPGESHPDLASLYVVYLEESSVIEARQMLRDLPEVEYVELPEPRKLIRPKRATSAKSRSHRQTSGK